jgi:hypothetical protein
MEESVSSFPFRKLLHDKFLTLEVLMHFKYLASLKFLFGVNKATRAFLENNCGSIKNGFINDGLIYYDLDGSFYDYAHLENLYY